MAKRLNETAWGEYVQAMAKHLESQFSRRNSYLDDVRSRRAMRINPKIPEQYKAVGSSHRSPLVYDLVRKSVAMLGTQMPEPKRMPLRDGEAEQRRSSAIEKWLGGAYVKMNEGKDTFLQGVDALMTDSSFVLQMGMDLHRWAGYKNEKGDWVALEAKDDEEKDDFDERRDDHHRMHFPFWWQQVPLDSYYPVYDADDNLAEVCIIGERASYPLAKQYGLKSDGGKLIKGGRSLGPIAPEGMDKNVKFIEYWNDEVLVRIVDDTVVEAKRHKYGRPPFFEARAVVTSSRDVVDGVMGIAAPLLNLQDNIDSLVTVLLNWAYLTGFPTPKLKPTTEYATLEPDTDYSWTIGKALVAPNGFDWEFLTMPQTGQDLKTALDYFTGLAKEIGLAAILSGQMPAGDVSGPAVTTVLAVAKSVFGTAVANLCKMFNEAGAWMLEMVDNEVSEAVPVWHKEWVKLGPDDIKGYYRIEHTMRYVLPAEQMQKAMFETQMKNMNVTIPNKKILEDGMGVQNPEDWEDETFVEKALEQPQIAGVVMQEATRIYKEIMNPQANTGTPASPITGPGGPLMPQEAGVQTPVVQGAPAPGQTLPVNQEQQAVQMAMQQAAAQQGM